MPWPLIALVLAYVALVLLAVVLCQRAALDELHVANRVKDAKIARLEGLVRFAGGTMRELVDAHCMCANDETRK